MKHALPAESPATLDLTGKVRLTPEIWTVSPGIRWQAYRYSNTGTVARASGKPIQIIHNLLNRDVIERCVNDFVSQHEADFGLKGCEMKVVSIETSLNWTIVTLQPQIYAIPVYDGYVVLSINQNGALASLKARGFGADVNGDFMLGEKDAARIAQKAIQVKSMKTDILRVYLPQRDLKGSIILRSAYQVTVATVDPGLQPVLFVDALNGDILAAENRVYFEQLEGQIEGQYFPNYGTEDLEQDRFPYEWLEVADVDSSFSDDEGIFSFEVNPDDSPFDLTTALRGLWVEVHPWDVDNADIGEIASLEMEIEELEDVEILWNEDNAGDDERNLFYHVNFVHDYWTNLEHEFDGLDLPMLAVCGLGGPGMEQYEDNAFSSGQGIYFGRGRQCDNFALYADVIYHEYTHSVTGVVYRGYNLPYEGESGALNEAWSDYFPCSISDEPLIGEGGLVGQGRHMRNLDNNLRYPNDIVDEVHMDARIIAGAMWHTREVLGASYCDSLFHFARYHHARDFYSYFHDILLTDDDDGDMTNGSPNYRVLYEEFSRHGIGVGIADHFVFKNIELADDNEDDAEGNSNGLYEADETIRLQVEIFRSGNVIPPSEADVFITLETDYPGIELVRGEVNFGQVQVGEMIEAPEPLLFRINQDAETGFADLFLTISAAFNEEPVRDTLHIVVGIPPLLLYRDGVNYPDYSEYYRIALEGLDIVYTEFSPVMQEQALSDQLGLFDAVIWFTGNAIEGILNDDDRSALADYLDNSGNLILSGQAAGEIEGTDEFFAEYLGARNVIDSLHQREVRGVENDPVGRGMRLLLSGSGAGNQTRPGAVEAVEPAVEAFYWPREEGEPAAGVRFENPESAAKSVYLSFGLEGIHNITRTPFRSEAIGAMLEWFGVIENSIAGSAELPGTFLLDAPYPNPFNDAVYVPFRLSRPGAVSIGVFDVSGREVWAGSGSFMTGWNVLPVNAHDWGTGLYFVKVRSNSGSDIVRIVLMK